MSGPERPRSSMEILTANLPTASNRSVGAFDPLRSRRFVERGLGELSRERLILHVEGHAFSRKVLRARMTSLLEAGGVALVSCPTAGDALSILRDRRVDLVIASSLVECQREPGLAEGVVFLRRCKTLFPGVPFVFYTAPGEVESQGAAADALVHKNGDFEELLATVRRFVPSPRDL